MTAASPSPWTHTTAQRPIAPPRVQSDTTLQASNGIHNAYSLENQSHSSASPPTGDSRLWPDLQPGQFAWDQNIVEASSASCDFSHLTDLDDIFTFTGNSFLPPALPPQSNDFPPITTYGQHGQHGQHGLHGTPLLPGPVSPLNGTHIPPRRSSAVHIPGLNPRDQEYLRMEGCFDLPSPHVLRIVMRMYFKMVHPNLPIVAEDQFWALWSGDDFRVGESSFLLLKSMIFAATSVSTYSSLYSKKAH